MPIKKSKKKGLKMDKNTPRSSRDNFEKIVSFTCRDWLTFLTAAFVFSAMCGLADSVNLGADKYEKNKRKIENTNATLIKTETKDNEVYLFFDTDNNPQTTEYIGHAPLDSEKDVISKVAENRPFKDWQKAIRKLDLDRARE